MWTPTSVDGYVAGPDDGPGRGLGTGGERLHYWVFGGPWSHEAEPTGQTTGADRAGGGGKGLLDGFDQSLEVEQVGVRQPPFATLIDYRVVRPTRS